MAEGTLTAWYDEWVFNWDDAKQQAWVAAHAAYEAATFGPGQLFEVVAGYLANLKQAEGALARMGQLVRQSNVPDAYRIQHQALEARYKDLAAPVLVDSQPAPSFGNPLFVPVIVVGGLALGAWAVAYAVAHVADAAALWRQCAAFEADGSARYKLAADGKPVPRGNAAPWERPPDGPDDDAFSKVITGLGLLIGLGIAANYVGARK